MLRGASNAGGRLKSIIFFKKIFLEISLPYLHPGDDKVDVEAEQHPMMDDMVRSFRLTMGVSSVGLRRQQRGR